MISKYSKKSSFQKESGGVKDKEAGKDIDKSSPEKLFDEGKALVIEFLKRKKFLQIDAIQIQANNKIKKIEMKKEELCEEAQDMEEKGNELITKGNSLKEETKKKREMVEKLDKQIAEIKRMD